MARRATVNINMPNRQAKKLNNVAKARTRRRGTASGKRARGVSRDVELPFAPPEDWHEPKEAHNDPSARKDYHIVVQSPGEGFRHVLSPNEIRDRLAQLPSHFVRPLDVVQLSRMTRKKCSFPCYGMQWGTAIYLYPIDETLIEYFESPPRPEVVNETKMYGARWEDEATNCWKLIWSEQSIKDYYLDNILIHELGHLLDERNTSYVDRERFAEWFAIEHGYRKGATSTRRRRRTVRRRHHARTV